ncbi:hypothetical protein NPIL_316431 [Nephila pilipes]|uniref:Uncharacterized protein n=1 Tax=Nephila pilipes TaxID=299642 RepID=A0A8X6QMG8_NEPPI|nr:hypothetical protein NPIL_316431 [Nephila pilipes]
MSANIPNVTKNTNCAISSPLSVTVPRRNHIKAIKNTHVIRKRVISHLEPAPALSFPIATRGHLPFVPKLLIEWRVGFRKQCTITVVIKLPISFSTCEVVGCGRNLCRLATWRSTATTDDQ